MRADPHQVMAWLDTALGRSSVQVLFGTLLLLVLTLLLSPPMWRSKRVVDTVKAGKVAEGNIKATTDFSYLPPEAKREEARRLAEAQVLPVFDHQQGLADLLSRRIKQAFELLAPSDAGVDSGPATDSAPPPRAPTAVAGGPGHRPEAAHTPAPPKPSADEDREAKRKLFSSILGLDIEAREFAQLLKASSAREVRGILLALVVEEAMGQLIVARRDDLQSLKDKPVTVRHFKSETQAPTGEERINNIGLIKDLRQVTEELQAKADVHAAKLPQTLARVVVRLAQGVVQPNLAFNSTETNRRIDAARRGVSMTPITVVKGQVIVRDGDPITQEHIHILRAMEPERHSMARIQIPIGVAFFVLMLLAVQYRFARREYHRFLHRPRDLMAMAVLGLVMVGLAKGVVALGGGYSRGQELPLFLFALPLASGAMLVRMLISAEAAAIFCTLLSLLSGFLMDQNLTLILFYLVTGLVAASGVSQVQSRATILRTGLAAGLVGAGLVLAFRMYAGVFDQVDTLFAALMAVAGGLLTAFVTLALLPAMEWLFAYTTDVTLLELANLNHPLLRDLILQAPGTYHHSMVVGSLAEAACEAIGANGLLARVASYYHDIGKTKNSPYFAENFRSGDNPHNRLKPSMSALIIRSHVKDTVELLREHGVPELVIDTATQHHGKTLIEFFFHKAKEAGEPNEEINEEDYRYPGPKPQSREAGIIMLADAVEAAARSQAEPTEDRLRAVVQRVINTKFSDGQLDHCDLTLRDLHNIARSFLQVLRGIYHQRPSYPWQQKQEAARKTAPEEKRETGKHRIVATIAEETRPTPAPRSGKGKGKGDRDNPERPEPRGKEAERAAEPEGKRGHKDERPTEPEGKRGHKDERPTEPEGKRGHKEAKRSDAQPSDKRAAHPAGTEGEPAAERESKDSAEPGGSEEDPKEGGQDLRRLGLN